jgi:hypothetical protein
MRRLLLAAALIAVALPAHAWQTLPGKDEVFSDQLTPQWRKAKPLHPVWEQFVDINDIPAWCSLQPTERLRYWGCAFTKNDTCFVYIASGLTDAQTAIVDRHERAHCAGFHHAPVQP